MFLISIICQKSNLVLPTIETYVNKKSALSERQAYSEPCQTSKMERSTKHSTLDVWQGFEYAYAWEQMFGLHIF